jgi:hypothetical protein
MVSKLVRITSGGTLSEQPIKKRPSEGFFKTSIMHNPAKRVPFYSFAEGEAKQFYFDVFDNIAKCREATDDITLQEKCKQLYYGSFDSNEIRNHFHPDMVTEMDDLIRNIRGKSRKEMLRVIDDLDEEVTVLLMHLHASMPINARRTSIPDKIIEIANRWRSKTM